MSHCKPHLELKNSGVESLGEAPRYWHTYDFWKVATPKSITTNEPEPLLSVYLDRGVIPYSEGGGLVHKPADSLEKYQLVEENDFVMNNQQAWRGSVGVSSYRGLVSPAYLIFSLDKEKVHPGFAGYCFRDKAYVEQYMLCSLSVGTIQRQIKWPYLKKVKIILPPIGEQKAIATFIDRETTRIDTLIQKKTRFIELLKEKRQALITHAVTKGLDPNAKMKDSGVDWLGEVPEGWEVAPLFSVASERSESNKGMTEDNLLSLSYGRIVTKDINTTNGLLPESFETYQIVYPGDTVFRLTDLQNDKRSLRTGLVREKGIITSAYAATIPEKIDHVYFNNLLHSYDIQKVFYAMGGGMRQSLKFSDIKRLPIVLPKEEEQKKISTFIDRETTRIDTLIQKKTRSIELLKERRTALITAAVTGKIDVRGDCTNMSAEEMAAI
jgi:type I restriction enzyme S subunit